MVIFFSNKKQNHDVLTCTKFQKPPNEVSPPRNLFWSRGEKFEDTGGLPRRPCPKFPPNRFIFKDFSLKDSLVLVVYKTKPIRGKKKQIRSIFFFQNYKMYFKFREIVETDIS